MNPDKTAIERAFELASSGAFTSASQVRIAVSAEGYAAAQISGPQLMRQLRELIRTSRKPEET